MLRQLTSQAVAKQPRLSVVSARAFSYTPPSTSSDTFTTGSGRLPGREIDLLEMQDTRFRLPGKVGLAVHETWLMKLQKLNAQATEPPPPATVSPVMMTHDELLRALEPEKALPNTDIMRDNERSPMHCEAHQCPELLLKDFHELFPRNTANLNNGLTVLTLTLKSDNDMAVWSREVAEEREQLLDKFVAIADRMCVYLREQGFWADFVDPGSGRPFYGEYTPATFFETDERYRHFGFEIEDLGCCKVISHHRWGTKAFVGSVFTNAMHTSSVVETLCVYLDD